MPFLSERDNLPQPRWRQLKESNLLKISVNSVKTLPGRTQVVPEPLQPFSLSTIYIVKGSLSVKIINTENQAGHGSKRTDNIIYFLACNSIFALRGDIELYK